MAQRRWSDRNVAMLPTPKDAAVEHDVPRHGGLRVVVFPSGKRSFIFRYRYRGVARKLTHGPFPHITLDNAIKLTVFAKNDIALGIDPATKKKEERVIERARRSAETFDDVALRFLRERRGRIRTQLRESSVRATGWLLGYRKNEAGEWMPTGSGARQYFHGRAFHDISETMIEHFLEGMRKRNIFTTANRSLTTLRMLFNWARQKKLIQVNPAQDLLKTHEPSRDRVLSEREIWAFWRATENERYPDKQLFRLLLYTGVRLSEARNATWKEFDLEAGTWTIPGERTKNYLLLMLPLPLAMIAMLREMPHFASGWLFTHNNRTPMTSSVDGMRRVRAAMTALLGEEPPKWTIHDLRRTFETNLQRLGVGKEVRDALMNHKTPGVGAVYGRYEFWKEKQAAMKLWADDLERISKFK